MQRVKKYWHKTRNFIEKNFLVSVLVLLLLQVLLLMRFDKVDISWSALSATVQLLLIMFQCVILYRQAQIMRRQAEISQKGLEASERANEIARRAILINFEEKSIKKWLDISEKLKNNIMTISLHDILLKREGQETKILDASEVVEEFFLKMMEFISSPLENKVIKKESKKWIIEELKHKYVTTFFLQASNIHKNMITQKGITEDEYILFIDTQESLRKKISNSQEIISTEFKNL